MNGRIYLVYADLPFPGSSTDRGDIFINEGVPQGDGSLNWTAVRKVNNDGTATDQWNPSVVINPVGTEIFIGYYSRQGDPSSNALIKAYGAKSNLTNGFATATFDVFPISATASFWRCPSDPSSSLFGGQRLPRVRSYSMNGYMDSTPGRIDMLDWKIFQQSTGIPVPSELFVMIDEREDTIVNGFFVVDMGNPRPLMYSAPRSAHNGGGVLGFADGHVIRKKWLDLASWPCVSPRGLGAGHGTDHIDRIDGAPRDLGWLQEHTTVQ